MLKTKRKLATTERDLREKKRREDARKQRIAIRRAIEQGARMSEIDK